MDDKSFNKQRIATLYPTKNNRFQAEWNLTDTAIKDIVKIALPPLRTIPIIFVPGIMGSNLSDLRGEPIWLLNSFKNIPAGLAYNWASKNAGERQALLHPRRTQVYRYGAVPKRIVGSISNVRDYTNRGWGEVSEASYHKFLLWLEDKMNGEQNPALWEDFSTGSLQPGNTIGEKLASKLSGGLQMRMAGLPENAEKGYPVEPVKSDDLLRRAKARFPVYAFGYNWLESNKVAGEMLRDRIEKVIDENNVGTVKCTQVILVTHSMGGLVARACSILPEMAKKIVGVVHGVMPANGAAVAYRRCKVGMRDEDFGASLVIGTDGREVTAVFAQASGALQLLPSETYGADWLEISDPTGKVFKSLPKADPYEEIYLRRNSWWGLVREEWLSPRQGMPIRWAEFEKNIRRAREFHRSIADKYHNKTYVFYGGGENIGSYAKIRWNMKKGIAPLQGRRKAAVEVPELTHGDIRADGSNNLYVGGEQIVRTTGRGDSSSLTTIELSDWELRCAGHDSTGDGTVPARSGREPRRAGAMNIKQQFELAGIQHEPAYRDYPTAQAVTYYAVTKLAALADLT